nr:probable cytochrome P450 6g2 [Onthophagus taurus]
MPPTFQVNEFLATILLLIILIYFLKKFTTNYWKLKDIPHEHSYPLLGNIPDILISNQTVPQYLSTLYKKYQNQPYFGIHLLHKPALVLRDPETIKNVLIKNFTKFSDRGFTNDKKADPLTCSSVFAVKNPEWKALRMKLSPIFTSGKMKLMVPLMRECSDSMVQYLEKKTLQKTVDVKDLIGKYTTDVISSCTFGLKPTSFDNDEKEATLSAVGKKLFEKSLLRKMSAFCYFLAPAIVKIFKFSFLDREATMYLHRLFWDVLQEREKGNIKRNDLIDILIELKNQKDENSIKFDGITISSQAVSFFSAGFETTSSTMSFALYELAMNVNVQNTLRQEINETEEKFGELTYDVIRNMKYLDMVFNETLRKYTQAPFLVRECKEDCLLEPYKLKIDAGVHVIIPIAGLHSDANYYKNPDVFDPERFNDESKGGINPYTYLPFGSGPRNCIGERFAHLSGKMGLISIVKNFEILKSSTTPTRLTFDHKALLLEAEGGIPLILKYIHHNMM